MKDRRWCRRQEAAFDAINSTASSLDDGSITFNPEVGGDPRAVSGFSGGCLAPRSIFNIPSTFSIHGPAGATGFSRWELARRPLDVGG